MYISIKINGVPYSKVRANRGNTEGPKIWSETIVEQTKDLAKIKEACIMNVTFLLPPSNFPTNFPYGNDLDNLLKRLCDALNDTIFSEAEGNDSCIVSLSANKIKVASIEEAGALLEIIPISITP